MSTTHRTAANLALLAAALLISFAAAEFALRFFVDLPLPRTLPEVRYDLHSVRRFTLRANQQAHTYGASATIRGDGLRSNGSERGHPSGGPVIIALGDSFTFGLGVGDAETWPARLEATLQSTLQQDLQVLNAGTISYGVFQELHQLEALVRSQHPVAVIHALYWNDYMNAGPPRSDEQPALTTEGYFEWDGLQGQSVRSQLSTWSNRSALLYTLKTLIRAALSDGVSASSSYGRQYEELIAEGLDSNEWAEIRNFYGQLKAMGERERFDVLCVLLPVIDIVTQPNPDQHPYAASARELLGGLGIPLVDSFELWGQQRLGRELFLPQGVDSHLNATGYAVLTDYIAAAVAQDPELRRRLSEDLPSPAK